MNQSTHRTYQHKGECLVNMRFIMQVRSISLPTKYIDFWLPFVLRVFEKSLQYVKRFSRYKNPDAVRQAREYPLVAVVYVWWNGVFCLCSCVAFFCFFICFNAFSSNLLPVGYGTKSLNLNQYSESLVDTSWLNLRYLPNHLIIWTFLIKRRKETETLK